MLGTVGLAATLVVALPVGMAGLELFVEGDRLFGTALVAVAAFAVVVEERVLAPTDVPAAAAERVAGAVVRTPGDEE
jgi:hypothetical protein